MVAQALSLELLGYAAHVAASGKAHWGAAVAGRNGAEEAGRDRRHGQTEFPHELRQTVVPVVGDFREALLSNTSNFDELDAPRGDDLECGFEVGANFVGNYAELHCRLAWYSPRAVSPPCARQSFTNWSKSLSGDRPEAISD